MTISTMSYELQLVKSNYENEINNPKGSQSRSDEWRSSKIYPKCGRWVEKNMIKVD